jgi:hypothetical protein
MQIFLVELKSKAVKAFRDNWKAVVLFVVVAFFAPPALYDLYQEHAKEEEIKSQADSSLRKAESLSDAGELNEAIKLYEEIISQFHRTAILGDMPEHRMAWELHIGH